MSTRIIQLSHPWHTHRSLLMVYTHPALMKTICSCLSMCHCGCHGRCTCAEAQSFEYQCLLRGCTSTHSLIIFLSEGLKDKETATLLQISPTNHGSESEPGKCPTHLFIAPAKSLRTLLICWYSTIVNISTYMNCILTDHEQGFSPRWIQNLQVSRPANPVMV